MAASGSPLFAMTWKQWDMPAGPPICALRASALRTSGKGFIGWPTPIVNDTTGSTHCYSQGNHDKPVLKLPGAVALTGWPTPKAQEDGRTLEQYQEGRLRGYETRKGKTSGGPSSLMGTLSIAVQLVGPARLTVSGEMLTGSTAAMENGGQLSPHMSRWLMGYPPAWCEAAILAHAGLKGKRAK
jgi:hypothetical protein